MTTIKQTGPLLYAVNTDKTEGVAANHIRVALVRYEVYEIPIADFDEMRFVIHDSATPEARALARAMAIEK